MNITTKGELLERSSPLNPFKNFFSARRILVERFFVGILDEMECHKKRQFLRREGETISNAEVFALPSNIPSTSLAMASLIDVVIQSTASYDPPKFKLSPSAESICHRYKSSSGGRSAPSANSGCFFQEAPPQDAPSTRVTKTVMSSDIPFSEIVRE